MRLAMPVSTVAGPELDEGACTPSSTSVVARLAPAHRAAQLGGEHAGPLVGVGVGRGVDVGDDGHLGSRIVDLGDRLAQPVAGRRHERRVERAADRAAASSSSRPSSLAIAPAASTASGDPAMTTWPGALKFATHTSPPARRARRLDVVVVEAEDRGHRAGASSAATCIASPRSATIRTPSSNDSAPVAASAVYSPRLWPARPAGLDPEALDRVEHDEAEHERGELRVAGLLELVGVGVEQEVLDVAPGASDASSTSSHDSCRPRARPCRAAGSPGRGM